MAVEYDSPSMPPMDRHNRELVSNVHPKDWRNPSPASIYNLVVIGGGTAGLVTAAGAAGLGAKVALVEKHFLGGDCLNVGCVPSKCLISSAKAYANVREAGHFGIRVPEGVKVDFAAVMERMRSLRAGISHHDSAARFSQLGVDIFLGAGRFSARDQIQVGDQVLRFKKAVIATGARATAPPVEGLIEAGYLTNETVFSLTELPRRLAVIGAGPIGCELAQSFALFGSSVVLLEMFPQILPREDPDAADVVKRSLLKDGVELVLEARLEGVESDPSGKKLALRQRDDRVEIVVDEILVGAGRIPNVDGLNLEGVGVDYDPRKGVLVNDRLQTSNSRVYAAGDICSPYQFTHTADAMARIVIQNKLFLGRKKASALVVPWCTFTDPEIAHVGLYEKEASDQGIEVDTFTRDLKDVDRAIVVDGETEGFVKVHVRKGTDKILGSTVVARHAGDMISELTLAMVGGAWSGNTGCDYPSLSDSGGGHQTGG